jgi:hypothetical protein
LPIRPSRRYTAAIRALSDLLNILALLAAP